MARPLGLVERLLIAVNRAASWGAALALALPLLALCPRGYNFSLLPSAQHAADGLCCSLELALHRHEKGPWVDPRNPAWLVLQWVASLVSAVLLLQLLACVVVCGTVPLPPLRMRLLVDSEFICLFSFDGICMKSSLKCHGGAQWDMDHLLSSVGFELGFVSPFAEVDATGIKLSLQLQIDPLWKRVVAALFGRGGGDGDVPLPPAVLLYSLEADALHVDMLSFSFPAALYILFSSHSFRPLQGRHTSPFPSAPIDNDDDTPLLFTVGQIALAHGGKLLADKFHARYPDWRAAESSLHVRVQRADLALLGFRWQVSGRELQAVVDWRSDDDDCAMDRDSMAAIASEMELIPLD